MATINSAGTGDWHNGATWVGGVAPGTGDSAVILNTHTVTVAVDLSAIYRITVNAGGSLVVNANITMDDASGAYIIIYENASSVFSTNATPSAPRYISSAGGVTPTYPWYFGFYKYGNGPRASINLDNVIMSGNTWYLGTHLTNLYVQFNTTATRVMLRPTPVSRDWSYNEHVIDGRSKGRIYRRGASAGRVTLRGYVSVSGNYWMMMENMKSSGRRVGLTTDIIHMPQAWVESLRWGEPKGNNLPFTMVLVEDL